MRGPRTDALRRSLHLSIDASAPYQTTHPSVSETSISPISSTRASIATSNMSWSTATDESAGADTRMCTVLCLYDFTSDDPDHLTFRAQELLDVVRQENTGWWAALRRDGGLRVGWIPSAFVKVLSDEVADTLWRARDEMRVWQPEDDELLEDGSIPRFADGSRRVPEWSQSDDESDPILTAMGMGPKHRESLVPPYTANPPPYMETATYQMPIPDTRPTRQQYPPTPDAPVPAPPPLDTAPLYVNKPTPPTPSTSNSLREYAGPAHAVESVRQTRHRSLPSRELDNPLPPVISINTSNLYQPDPESEDETSSSIRSPRMGKVKQITGDDVAEKIATARVTQAMLPWYLRTSYLDNELKMEFDGVVKAGTLAALVERLTAEQLSPQQEQAYRHVFLTTFRTFASPDDVFSLLVQQYEMDHPPNLADEEFADWKEWKLRPTQKRALKVMEEWLENHNMLHEEPQVARRLQHFLGLIVAPPSLASIARTVLQTLERLTFAPPSPPLSAISPVKRKKFRMHKNDLAKMDPLHLAQHITMLEWRLYARIKSQECLNWAKTQSGPTVAHMAAFCATHDKVATWVKHSVLANDGLGKRADMVDFWIKVAEKCRSINNFASTTAIVAGLASTVISKLHLTWAHVSRTSHLEPLVKLNEPTGNFSAYRSALAAAEGPCLPFVGTFLSDIVHVQDQHPDVVLTVQGHSLIHFVKRQRWADAIHAILRHQARPYAFAEDSDTVNFVERQIADAVSRDPAFFWSRSQELQQAELAHADIRKGLEAAGF